MGSISSCCDSNASIPGSRNIQAPSNSFEAAEAKITVYLKRMEEMEQEMLMHERYDKADDYRNLKTALTTKRQAVVRLTDERKEAHEVKNYKKLADLKNVLEKTMEEVERQIAAVQPTPPPELIKAQ